MNYHGTSTTWLKDRWLIISSFGKPVDKEKLFLGALGSTVQPPWKIIYYLLQLKICILREPISLPPNRNEDTYDPGDVYKSHSTMYINYGMNKTYGIFIMEYYIIST